MQTLSFLKSQVLGGSSALNFLVYQRGHRRELDDLEALGNEGWNWSSLCPYYTRSVSASAPTHDAEEHFAHLSEELKTTSGPLKVSHNSATSETSHRLTQFTADLLLQVAYRASVVVDSVTCEHGSQG